jgi:hypothetical protein
MAWDNGVTPPGGVSYAAPLMDFGEFGNLANVYRQAGFDQQRKVSNEQQQQLNQQQIQAGQQRQDIAKTFQGGLPRNADGSVDYASAVAMLAKKGDVGALWNGADAMAIQGASKLSPMLANGAQPGQGQGAPSSVAAKPLPPMAANSPQGDAGQGTIASIVTDRLPNQDATTGQTIAKVAQVMGLDPNANLTAGQIRRAQGLVQKYAASSAPASDANAGTLPPSANAGTPAPPASSATAPAPPASFNDRFASAGGGAPQAAAPAAVAPQAGPGGAPAQPQPQPQQPQAQPQGQPLPPQQAAQPLVPQVPLPKGFNDPQQAILALRAEAARLAANPRAREQANQLTNWAERIENSIKPMQVHQGTNIIDPRTGQPLYQGNQPTLSPDAINAAAERYLETGQLPPNLGRGTQGSATMSAIQNHAAELANQRGIDMATLPGKWQQFKAQQVGIQRFTSGKQGDTVKSFNVLVDHLDTLTEAASALKNGDMRLFNRFKQNWAANTGNTAPTNFDGVKALVGDEIVKAVVGSAGALADREEVKKDLDRASSPKQLSELVDRYRKLALGQLRGLRKQYEVATGQKNFGDLLLPGTLAALGGNEGKGSAPDAEGWVTLPNGARIQEVK